MHLYLVDVQNPWYVWVGGQALVAPVVGNWQTIQGSFSSPVQNLRIDAFWSVQTIPGSVAIDAVEFTTVPEPQTFWLLTVGLGAILLRRSKSLKSQSR